MGSHIELVLEGERDAVQINFATVSQEFCGVAKQWAESQRFERKLGQILIVPNAEGGIAEVFIGTGRAFDPMAARGLSARLPGGLYRLEVAAQDAELATLAFLLGA